MELRSFSSTDPHADPLTTPIRWNRVEKANQSSSSSSSSTSTMAMIMSGETRTNREEERKRRDTKTSVRLSPDKFQGIPGAIAEFVQHGNLQKLKRKLDVSDISYRHENRVFYFSCFFSSWLSLLLFASLFLFPPAIIVCSCTDSSPLFLTFLICFLSSFCFGFNAKKENIFAELGFCVFSTKKYLAFINVFMQSTLTFVRFCIAPCNGKKEKMEIFFWKNSLFDSLNMTI